MSPPLRLPQFIIGGAPRSGTTWLYHALARHPQIALAKPLRPEPKFFLVDELYERGLEYYSRQWFADIPADKVAGEKSTNYLEGAGVAERIHGYLPHVKLIFILRNPVDRAYSNYRWSRMNGMETEEFGRALELEAERERTLPSNLRYARPHAYFSRGLYHHFLAPYLERFPSGQILVLRFEDCVADAAGVGKRIHCFLGVAPRPQDMSGDIERNESTGEERLASALRASLAARYAEPNRRLSALLHWTDDAWSE